MKRLCTSSLLFLLTVFFAGLFVYGLLSLTGALDHKNISHSKILAPHIGAYECYLVEIFNLHHAKNNPATIRSVSVSCRDQKSGEIKKYTFTQYDGLPQYIKGLDNHEGWYVNSVNISTDLTLEPGERYVLIFTAEKPLKTNVFIYLSK